MPIGESPERERRSRRDGASRSACSGPGIVPSKNGLESEAEVEFDAWESKEAAEETGFCLASDEEKLSVATSHLEGKADLRERRRKATE